VSLGALVTVDEQGASTTYWIAPEGGGSRLEGGAVQVVTPKSPLGRALLGKAAGDTSEVTLGGRVRVLEIMEVA
jgi:transcription elongation GreA/GreB family factor